MSEAESLRRKIVIYRERLARGVEAEEALLILEDIAAAEIALERIEGEEIEKGRNEG
jgi:hypothetical protein